MFSVRPGNGWPGFSVGLEDLPGFRIGDDASRLANPTAPAMGPTENFAFGPSMSDALWQTSAPLYAPTGSYDLFAGNPYWSPNTAAGGPIAPVRYGSPFPSAPPQSPTVGPMTPLGVGPQVSGLPDRAAPSGDELPSALDTLESPTLVQYKSSGAPQSAPPPKMDTAPGEIVVLPDGSAISDAKSPTGYVMSPKADLQDVAAKGRQIGETYRAMLSNPVTSAGALLYLYAALGLNGGQGGTYDHQRRGNMITGYTQLPQFRPIANVNVGLLGQQAGLTLEETLDIAGLYARLRSSNADPSGLYGLDHRTMHYITRGHEIGRSGLFDPPGRR